MADTIYAVYQLCPQLGGSIRRQSAGRYVVSADRIEVLEDPVSLLRDLDGPITDRTMLRLRNLRNSAYLEVIADGDHDHHRQLRLIQPHDLTKDPSGRRQR